MRLDASIVIDRPVGDVWRFCAVNHVQNHPRWDPDIELEQTSDGPIGLGTILRRRNSRSGTPVDGSMEVVEFDPERSMRMLIRDGPLQMNGFAIFAAQDPHHTLLTIGADIPWLDESSDSQSISGTVQGGMRRSTERIKTLIETEIPPP